MSMPEKQTMDSWKAVKHTRWSDQGIMKYKKWIVAALLATGAIISWDQLGIYSPNRAPLESKVQERNNRLNHTFSLDELTPDAIMRELVVTTLYDYSPTLDMLPKTEWRISKVRSLIWPIGDFLRRVPQTWWVLLRAPDIQSADTIRESVSLIRSENPSAIIVMDFEGGYIRAPIVPEEDLIKYAFPPEILEMARNEKSQTKNDALGQFPSAEYIGKQYTALKDPQKKLAFKTMMQQYWRAIGTALAAYGINMILWPSLDITDNKIGTSIEVSPMAKNDRIYSSDPTVISDLWNSFIWWVIQVPGIIAVPKHFVWSGLTHTNTDKEPWDARLIQWAIGPFRDYVNMHEIRNLTPEQAQETLRSLQPWGQDYKNQISSYDTQIADKNTRIAQLQVKITALRVSISQLQSDKKIKKDTKKKKIAEHQKSIEKLKHDIIDQGKRVYVLSTNKGAAIKRLNSKAKAIQEATSNHIGKPPVIMTGNNSNNFYEKGVPGSLSHKTTTAINSSLWTTHQKGLWWMWLGWIIITDDLNTWSIRRYLWMDNRSFADASNRALAAWNNILLFGDSMVGDIVEWAQGVSPNKLKDNARKMLDLKAALGIYMKIGDKYVLNPKMYTPTSWLVSESAQASRYWTKQWSAYAAEKWKIPEISAINGMKNAITNSILDKCRIDPNMIEKLVCMVHPNMYDTYRSPDEDTLKKQLIIVDKREQMLYAYDLETRTFLNSTPIAIGKWTWAVDAYHDKKVAGDKKTPVGYYMVVQKKDPRRIKATIESELYDEYGGDDGGMLVLGWSWQPQIAIHGTKKESVWPVSSGCVRMDNETIRVMMDTVPLGSMVVITN